MGGRSIACLNARDRNLLGFRRDLLTASAYGVDQFLFVYGDEPLAGARTSELTVRTMLAEGRAMTVSGTAPACASGRPPGCGPLPAWKRAADFLFVQIGFSLDDLLAWRAQVEVDVPVYAGVIVVASPAMARNFTKRSRASPSRWISSSGWSATATPASTPPATWWPPSATRAPSTVCTSFRWRATARCRPAWSGCCSDSSEIEQIAARRPTARPR